MNGWVDADWMDRYADDQMDEWMNWEGSWTRSESELSSISYPLPPTVDAVGSAHVPASVLTGTDLR